MLRPWSNPNKNTTWNSLTRAVGDIANASNPLSASGAAAQGLKLHAAKTKALILGQSDLVTFVTSVNASAASSAAGDLRCFVDKEGQLVGLEQGGAAACSLSGDAVVVPTTKGYISQVQLAYTYDGIYVARLILDLRANATAEPVSYSCGSAGGKAVNLLPSNKDYVVTKLGVGCQPLPGSSGSGSGRRLRRRRLNQQQVIVGEGLGVAASDFAVAAAPLSVLPLDPATGVPQTPSGIGDILVPEEPVPVPTTTPVPAEGPPGPPGGLRLLSFLLLIVEFPFSFFFVSSPFPFSHTPQKKSTTPINYNSSLIFRTDGPAGASGSSGCAWLQRHGRGHGRDGSSG